MNKKRSAPGSEPVAASTVKKRKMDNLQKFYAVQVGFRPGVYLNYADCSKQTTGFKGAIFKSFTSMEDAKAFAAGKKVSAPADEPDRFYAVAVGSPTGIYRDWSDAAAAIKGVKGPKYRRFDNRSEAVAYIRQYGSRDAVEALGEMVDDEPIVAAAHATTSKSTKKTAASKTATSTIKKPSDNVLQIYTDGSSLANGKAGSRAGVGVFFGDGDPRNVSERLPGEPQTNQRAELMAILRALQIAPVTQPVQIVSDSQYSINCVTQWAPGWKRKGWMTASGEMVKNKDLIEQVIDLIEQRTLVGGTTYFHWVKGHATDRGNMAADRLAVRGAKIGVV
ncbi:Ribonuclease H [Purpureocillium takamizusanense]|uniref:Ribonuclease H n=1 Tax=Purpureocillium takamizusanense TaxID=2060973 RepID=A0A9Q8QKN4_9HYPO|nr:Ribonuclease H [Purpureocillium takamizusanense]UNI20317.1 Ribonuclease H [Purpureocillium takamizusanense]